MKGLPWVLAALLAWAAGGPPARAQDAPDNRPAAAAQPAAARSSLPAVADVLKVIDKASAPREGDPTGWSTPVKLAVVFTILALLPSLLVMMTSFTRIVIVLAFVRRALTTQTIPPTIAIIGLALFLTLFTMAPTFSRINDAAVQPYLRDQISLDLAIERGHALMKQFMLRQSRPDDLALFVDMAGIRAAASADQLPAHVVIPAFAISELRIAFEMGCLLFVPFLLIDLVVAAVLLSAGMMMLPPAMISLPFKIVLFILVDGWQLVVKSLVAGFH